MFAKPIPVLLLLVALTFASCSSDSGSDPMTPGGPTVATLVLPVATTTAGSTYPLPDLADLDLPTRGEITVHVGGEPASILIQKDGTHLVGVPLFLDAVELWSVPPSSPVRVEVFEDDELIATSAAELIVNPMAEAPGTAQSIVTDLGEWLDDLEQAFAEMPLPAGAGEAYAHVLFPALREIVDLHSEHSLQAMLDGLTPQELRLMDGMSNAVGMDDSIDRLLVALNEATGGGGEGKRAKMADPCGTELTDTNLAAFMQFSTYAQQFTTDFVSGFAADLAGTNSGVGLALLADLGQKVPLLGEALGVANLVLGFVDLFLNKYVVAMLPTHIESLSLEIEDTSLNIDDMTESVMTLCARNEPPGVTINDIVAQIINLAALVSPGGAGDIRTAVETVVLFLLEQINNGISAYLGANPGVQISTELFEVPTLHWSTTIEDSDLVQLLSGNTDVCEVMASELEWKALDVGSSSVSFLPSTGASAVVIPGYTGGAFGDQVLASNAVEITVGGLVLEVNMASSVEPNGVLALGAKAGHKIDGVTEWEPFISIVLQVEGGTSDPDGGSTDQDGDFISLITPSEGASEIEVVVTATDSDGYQVEETVTAVVEGTTVDIDTRSSFVAAVARDPGCDDDNRDSTNLTGAWAGNESAGCGPLGLTASQSTTVVTREDNPELPELLRAHGSGTVTASGSWSDYFNATSSLALHFHVKDGPAKLILDFSLEFPGLGNQTGGIFLKNGDTGQVLIENYVPGNATALEFTLPAAVEPYEFLIRAGYGKNGYAIIGGDQSKFTVDLKVVEVGGSP